MSVIGDKYDNFQRGEGIFHTIVRPKLAKLRAFYEIEEGDYLLVIRNIPNTNYVFDTYYKIQKIYDKTTFLVFYNGANIKIKYRKTSMYEYELTSSIFDVYNLKIVKFEDELEHYQMLQQQESDEIDT